MFRTVRTLITFMLSLVIVGSTLTAAGAQPAEAPKLGITAVDATGPYFDLTMAPGEQRALTVRLRNFGTAAARARTYAADAYTILNGGFGAELADEPSSGVTKWLDFTPEVIELNPGEEVERAFTVTVPETATPGEYITSVVIQNADPAKGSGDITLEVVNRQAIAVAITVPGPRTPALQITDATYELQPAHARILVGVANTGNVHLRPTGAVAVQDDSGDEIARATITMDTFYAGTETALELILVQPLAPADYTVTVSLADTDHGLATDNVALPLTVDNVNAQGTPVAEVPVTTIASVAVNPVRDPITQALQGVELVTQIANPAPPIPSGQLTLHVTRDGQPVEDYVLGSALNIPTGTTEIRQRYVPLGGWTPGTYRFAVTLAANEPATGQEVEVTTGTSETTVVVPQP